MELYPLGVLSTIKLSGWSLQPLSRRNDRRRGLLSIVPCSGVNMVGGMGSIWSL
jgi:hypothetical protein